MWYEAELLSLINIRDIIMSRETDTDTDMVDIARNEGVGPGIPSAPKTRELRPSTPLNILYVQSNARMREINLRAFPKTDTVTTAASVEEAKELMLERARKGEPSFDIVFSGYYYGPERQNGVHLARYTKDLLVLKRPLYVLTTADMAGLNLDYSEEQRRTEGVDMEIETPLMPHKLREVKKKFDETVRIRMQQDIQAIPPIK